MKIIVFEAMPEEQKLLEGMLPEGHNIQFIKEKLTAENIGIAKDADIISVFVNSEVKKDLIDRMPQLKLITTRSVGYDHIDVAYAKTKNIHVHNVTTYAAHPVSEFAFALLLAVTRRIYPAYNQLREGTNFDQRELKGYNMFGKTLGVVGTGRIGHEVVKIARGFGMEVIASDPKPDEVFATEQGFQYAPLEELAAKSDVITVHAPYLEATHHLISKDIFAKMKKGVIFINTARGEIVDTLALVAALQNGTVWGAGLDVLEGERALKIERNIIAKEDGEDVNYELLAANHVLIDLPNVVITPHIAFETVEAVQEIERSTAQSINDFIDGKEQQFL